MVVVAAASAYDGVLVVKVPPLPSGILRTFVWLLVVDIGGLFEVLLAWGEMEKATGFYRTRR